MLSSDIKGRMVILASFLLALILQTIPWPGTLNLFRPPWLLLVCCYWVLALPHRVNVGSALVMGLLWDSVTRFHLRYSRHDDVNHHLSGRDEFLGTAQHGSMAASDCDWFAVDGIGSADFLW